MILGIGLLLLIITGAVFIFGKIIDKTEPGSFKRTLGLLFWVFASLAAYSPVVMYFIMPTLIKMMKLE